MSNLPVHVPVRYTTVAAGVPRAVQKQFYAVAKQQGRTPSQVLRELVEAWLKQQEGK
jgi:hypothetical protein